MKQLLYLLPLALCPVSAQVADAESACMAALDTVKNSQSEYMGPVVTAVMDATGGDERMYAQLLKKAADSGHPVALTWLARQSLRQLQAARVNLETAPEAARLRAVMEQAASQGYIPAVVEMAHFCGSGIGAPANEKEGMKYLMQACKANSARARAAYLLLSGRLEKEGATGAAVASELKRNNFYVEEFLSAFTAPSDEAKSREWLTLASKHGSPGAACSLALYYLNQGKDALGYEFLKLAAERDHAEALAQLAALTLPGAELSPGLKGIIKPDAEESIRLFRRAVLLGYPRALIPLAGEYHKQPEKYAPERVFELYRQAADAGDPRGGVAYAYCLVVGRGCSPDAERGIRILRQLVDAGVPFANMALADLYFNGSGVEADMTKALSCLTTAASMGVPQSYTLMAVISQLGNAAKPSDPARARMYLRMAQERGEISPQQTFDTMVQAGSWKFMP
ncbi:MAG: sel1 repeat family protein [Akkermansia sp.]|nr:sel1 repeat family protein [Akkermansia sp.]MBQ8375568.1 sel1 repeat family protein [Akkermansia sp.]